MLIYTELLHQDLLEPQTTAGVQAAERRCYKANQEER